MNKKSRNEGGLTDRGREGENKAQGEMEGNITMSYENRKLNLLRQISNSFSSYNDNEDNEND